MAATLLMSGSQVSQGLCLPISPGVFPFCMQTTIGNSLGLAHFAVLLQGLSVG